MRFTKRFILCSAIKFALLLQACLAETVTFPWPDDAVRAVVSNEDAQRWNGSAYETHVDGNWAAYLLTPSRLGTSEDLSVTLPAGASSIAFYEGTSPAVGDAPIGASTVGTPSVADIAAGILATPANLLTTNASGEVVTDAPSRTASQADLTATLGHLTDIKGPTWDSGQDTLELIKDTALSGTASASAINAIISTAFEIVGGGPEYRLTTVALANAPTGGGTTQPRQNKPAGRAFQLKLSSRNDGTHKATRPIRLRPGAVNPAISIDMSPVFGDIHVKTVGTPTVSSGSITATDLGPRDELAMVQLGGTATASEEVTVTVPVTMDTDELVNATFDIKVFAD